MPDRYLQLGDGIARQAARLRTQGWEPGIALKLAASLSALVTSGELREWPEASGRAETVVETLNRLRDEGPEPGRLAGALHSAERLAELLRQIHFSRQGQEPRPVNVRQGQDPRPASVQTSPPAGEVSLLQRSALGPTPAGRGCERLPRLAGDFLPPCCADWTLVFLGLEPPPRTADALSALGFDLRQTSDPDAWRSLAAAARPLAGFASLDWLAAQPASPRPRLEMGLARPVLIGVADGAAPRARLRAKQQGALALIEDLGDPERLPMLLAGLAWRPARPYRALLVAADPAARLNRAARLRAAGFEVAAFAEAFAAGDRLAAFDPEVLLLDAAASDAGLAELAPDLAPIELPDTLGGCQDPPVSGLATAPPPDTNDDPLVTLSLRGARRRRRQKARRRQGDCARQRLDRLRDALDAHAIVSVTDAGGAIVQANDNFCWISGYRREELLGRNHRLLRSGHHPPSFFDDMWSTIAAGQNWHGVVQNRGKDGQPYWVQCTIVPFPGDDGQPEEYISIRTDITAQRRMLDELKQQQRLFDVLSQSLQHYIQHDDLREAARLLLVGMLTLTASEYGFLGEVVHDVEGYPALKMHASTNIARPGEPASAPPAEATIADMEFYNPDNLFGHTLRTGETVIANDPSRHPRSRGTPPWHPALRSFLGIPVHLGGTLIGMVGLANRPDGYDERILAYLAPLVDAYAILVEAARLRAYRIQVIDEIDRSRVQALAARHAQSVRIVEAAQALRAALETLAADARTLADAAPDSSARGVALAALRRGIAGIEEDLNRLEALPGEMGAGPDPLNLARASRRTQQAPRVLVAEDDPTSRAIMRAQLSTLGVTVELVDTGAAALAAWQGGDWDLILTDYNMPDMNGGDLTRAIRLAEQDRGGHIPIVAITGGLPETLHACRIAGMDDILSKPVRLEGLRGMLARWLPGAERPAPEPVLSRPAAAASILDLDLLRIALGTADPEQLRGILDLFTRTARTELEQCASALERREARELAQSAHKLKSSARTVGATRFAERLTRLEEIATARNLEPARACLRELDDALADVERAAVSFAAAAPAAPPTPDRVAPDPATAPDLQLPRRVLVVDDDAVIRRQLTLALGSLGVTDILATGDGEQALRLLDTPGGCELIVTDLNMPGMDGIQLLRALSAHGYRERLILASGVEDRLLQSALELARLQGLNVHGVLRKPVARDALAALLSRPGTDRRAASAASAASADTGPSLTVGEILQGIRDDEFAIHFQPKVDANTLRLVGVEALARWHHRLLGPVPPDQFIAAAEREGAIGPLSAHLIARSFRDIARLGERGRSLAIAVNLSASALNEVHLPEALQASVHDHGLRVEDVILEITETGVMADPRTALDIMMRLRLLGFRLSIDDFGVGYSSMQQLQRFPFSELKLDRGFVHGAARDPATRAILTSSVQMARKLGLKTVAEGVETQEDLDLVRALGCDLVQGWLVARAMPIAGLIDWIERGSGG